MKSPAASSSDSPDLIFTANFVPPPIDMLPPREHRSNQPREHANQPRIGLFELRRQLDRRPARSSSSYSWLTPVAVLLLLFMSYESILSILSFSVWCLGSLLNFLTLAFVALSMIGTLGVVCSSRVGSLVHDAISPPNDDEHEEVPLPSEDRRRRYEYMANLHEWLKIPTPSLLGLAVNIRSPTDAAGAPIDADAWGDF